MLFIQNMLHLWRNSSRQILPNQQAMTKFQDVDIFRIDISVDNIRL